MRPTERVLEVDSTLTGERVGMGIDESALNHIMSVLTDLYSDPELAVLREYSTNALDAHRDAGNPMPIEVTLPTQLSPFFRVRDYGDGLDADGIRNIYSRYGTSTKRDSNDVVGMLGLGCKSALTYTDQFTLVGTKDGRTVQVSVSRDEDGGGSMTIVSDEETPDAPSGVEVIVPAKRDNAFAQKARDFFRFWTPGTVLVGGAEPAHIATTSDGTWLVKDELLICHPSKVKENTYGDDPAGWVVMGNVAYPLPVADGTSRRGRKYTTIAFVEIGAVNFTPSREALQLTKRTKDTLAEIEARTAEKLAISLRTRVLKASNAREALTVAAEAAEYGIKDTLTYKGRGIPDRLERASTAGLRQYLVIGGDRYAKKGGDNYRMLDPVREGRMIFTGYAAADMSKPKRDKLALWLTEQGLERPKQIVCVDSLTPDEIFWLDGTPVFDWAPIQALKVARDPNGYGYSSRPSGSYSMRLGAQWGDFLAEAIPTDKPIIAYHGNSYSLRAERSMRDGYVDESVTVVCLPANRVGKFERDFPQAIRFHDYLTSTAAAWAASQTPAELEAAWYQLIARHGSSLSGLDAAKIDDPTLHHLVELANRKVGTVVNGLRRHRQYLTPPTLPTTDPFAKYPLLTGSYGAPNKEHTYLYVNAAYAASITSRQGEE